MRAYRLALVLFLSCAACASAATDEVSIVAPHARITAAESNGPGALFVAHGTRVYVRLSSTLDTLTSQEGQQVTAQVTFPVRDSRGIVVVPAGSYLHGQVVSVGEKSAPRLRLELDTIDTVSGRVPVQTKLVSVRKDPYAGPEPPHPETDSLCRRAGTESDPFCDSYMTMIHSDTAPPHGFGRPPPTDDRPREIRIEKGAPMVLVLTDDLAIAAIPASR